MNIEKFTRLFEQQFEDSDEVKFEINTNFKQLDEWSSIMSLLIITMVNDNYDIVINADDIKNSSTIEDLYNVVLTKK